MGGDSEMNQVQPGDQRSPSADSAATTKSGPVSDDQERPARLVLAARRPAVEVAIPGDADYAAKLRRNAARKRAFDLTVTILGAAVWLPVVVITALLLLVVNGRPVLYRSKRRVWRTKSIRVAKFRTMFRDADRILNRQTVPINGQRFLNIPLDSPAYTPLGRLVERLNFTELPQFFHVLRGSMSIVGNRPLPEDVIEALRERHPHVEARFLSPAGMTGPVQLVGRDEISDHDRLTLETEYCRICLLRYSFRLDFVILAQTILIALRIVHPKSVGDVRRLMRRCALRGVPAPVEEPTGEAHQGREDGASKVEEVRES